jgi:hypothetical protein
MYSTGAVYRGSYTTGTVPGYQLIKKIATLTSSSDNASIIRFQKSKLQILIRKKLQIDSKSRYIGEILQIPY